MNSQKNIRLPHFQNLSKYFFVLLFFLSESFAIDDQPPY